MSVTVTHSPLDVRLFRLRPTAVLPKFGSMKALCFDLCIALDTSDVRVVVRKGEVTMVGTGWQFQLPPMCGMTIHPRSGLGTRAGLVLANTEAIIDNDYTGEVMLALTLAPHALTDSLELANGDRVAQARLVEMAYAKFRETQFAADSTNRGAGGFGSTGVA